MAPYRLEVVEPCSSLDGRTVVTRLDTSELEPGWYAVHPNSMSALVEFLRPTVLIEVR